MSIFKEKKLRQPCEVSLTIFNKNNEIAMLKIDISLLLDVILCDKKLSESEWLDLLKRHNKLFFEKISMNKIRELVGMESVEHATKS